MEAQPAQTREQCMSTTKEKGPYECFCTCNCGYRTAHKNEETPYWSDSGVQIKDEDGKVKTEHCFCDIKYYNRAAGSQKLCSPND